MKESSSEPAQRKGKATTRKVTLSSLTWVEAREAFTGTPPILLPLGSIEQHGPQTPVGDYRYMTEVARRMAEASDTGALVLPTIPWGYSEYFRNFPGCITLAPETLKALLNDMLGSLIPHGLTKFVFVCGHRGNMPIIEQVARDLMRTHGIRPATVEPITWLDRAFLAECYGMQEFSIGHGSDPMSSIALHLFPNDTRPDLIQAGQTDPAFAGAPYQGMSSTVVNGVPVTLYVDTEELAANGVLGDPSVASREVGRRCVERMVDYGVKFLDWYAAQEPAVFRKQPLDLMKES